MKMNEASVKDVEKLESAPTELERWEKRHPPADILPATDSPSQVLANAIARGAGEKALEMLERAFELDLRSKLQHAEEEFNSDFAEASKDMPEIPKDKENRAFKMPDGKYSKYSSLGMMVKTTKPHMAKYGFRYTFPTPEKTDNNITCHCKLTHRLGHSEITSQSAPIVTPPGGERSAMNAQQAVKATVTYLRSTALEGALGIVGSEATIDIDGNSMENGEVISDDQFATIQALMDETKTKEGFFCKSMKIESIDKMPVSKYESAVKILEARRI
jgi:hypothetical protein